VSVFDFTDASKPFEIAFFDRGPLDAKQLITGGYWSAYWYNGRIYATEVARGLDVFRLTPSEHLSQDEIGAAMLVRSSRFNAQQQERFTWPATSLVARAYLDQLTRSGALDSQRVAAARRTLNRSDELRGSRDPNAAGVLNELDSLATQVEAVEATAPSRRDSSRLRALAATVRGIGARLR
jgi:hypothetical protein